MNKTIARSLKTISIFFLFFFGQCKKEQSTLTVTLYDKSLQTIQYYIQGKWKCHYGKGGIVANMVQYYDNFYWEFNKVNRIRITNNGITVTDATGTWYKEKGTYTNGDSTFILRFYDKRNVPWNYVIERIASDTLIIHDYSVDAVFYHLTRSN